MFSAKDAKQNTKKFHDIKVQNKLSHEEIELQCQRALVIIEADIKTASAQGQNNVRYTWEFMPVNTQTKVFPSFTDSLYYWDGAEGYRDKPSPTGKHLKALLEVAGYDVWMGCSFLNISW
jgi:hypothetical protein